MGTYSDPGLAARYDSARKLPAETLNLWMKTLVEVLPQRRIQRIVDLGCGTGRFSPALAETFGCPVLACDPSFLMLTQHEQTEDVYWFQSQAEHIPLPSKSIDLIWMSQIFHHLSDSQAAFTGIHDVLVEDGVLALRNGTIEGDRDGDIRWVDFFPEAAQATFNRVATRSNILQSAQNHGFKTVRIQSVGQFFANSYEAYYERIRQRVVSPLVEISDQAFAVGLSRLRSWIDAQPESKPVRGAIDFFVFQKDV